MVGEGGFEPPKSVTTDLQSAPFGRSGTLPFIAISKRAYLCELQVFHCRIKSWWTDSNPRPADYKSAALPTELHQRIFAHSTVLDYYTIIITACQELSEINFFFRLIPCQVLIYNITPSCFCQDFFHIFLFSTIFSQDPDLTFRLSFCVIP